MRNRRPTNQESERAGDFDEYMIEDTTPLGQVFQAFHPGEDEFRPASTQSSKQSNQRNSLVLESIDSREMKRQQKLLQYYDSMAQKP